VCVSRCVCTFVCVCVCLCARASLCDREGSEDLLYATSLKCKYILRSKPSYIVRTVLTWSSGFFTQNADRRTKWPTFAFLAALRVFSVACQVV
jgi:hypothetical protein